MLCSYCGKELTDDVVYCLNCGRKVEPVQQVESITTTVKWSRALFAILMVLTIPFPIIGLVGSIVGIMQKENRQQGLILLATTTIMLVIWFYLILKGLSTSF